MKEEKNIFWERKFIQDFIDDTPRWLESIRVMNEYKNGESKQCYLCGIKYEKIEKLLCALQNLVEKRIL